MYNIIWFDDEHEDLKGTKAKAARYNLKLTGFTSVEAGMRQLEENAAGYDAVLLDAMFFEKEGDAASTEDTSAAIQAKHAIGALKKHFEIFVLTGQSEEDIDKTFHKVFPGRIYRKGTEEDDDRLFNDLKAAAEEQPEAQIREEFPIIIETCTDSYISDTVKSDVFRLLIQDKESSLNPDNLNDIRKIVERMMQALQDFSLLPREITALNAQSRFLAGMETESNDRSRRPSFTLHNDNLPPKHIANLLRSLVETTQEGSHAQALDAYLKSLNTQYLIRATLHQLLSFIEWFKSYIDSAPRVNNWRTR